MTTGNTITTTNESSAIAGLGHLAFFANTRYWVFYCDSNAEYYRTSLDKTTWSTATAVANIPDDDGIVYVGYFSVVSDGTYVHMALTDDSYHGGTWYRRATINSNGTLTYSAAWQTVDLDTAGTPIIALDSNGYPWISMNNDWDTGYPMVWKSSTKDGTWTNVSGFPYTPESKTDYPNLAPLTSGKMGVVLFSNESSKAVKYIEWSGSAWGSISTVDTNTNNTPWRNSVATYGDNIIACYNSNSLDLTKYIDRVSSSWGGGTLIAHGSIYTSIAIDPTTGNAYAFTGYDTNNTTLLYQMYTAGTNTWGTLTTLVDDTPNTNIRRPQPFYLTGSIGIVYIESVGAPYYIKFASLSLGGGGGTTVYTRTAPLVLTGNKVTSTRAATIVRSKAVPTGNKVTVGRVLTANRAAATKTGNKTSASRVLTAARSSLTLTGNKISATRAFTAVRNTLTKTGEKVSAGRALTLSRSATIKTGNNSTASRILTAARSTVTKTGQKVTASRVGVFTRAATVKTGNLVSAILQYISFAGNVYNFFATIKTGNKVSGSRTLAAARSATLATGNKISGTRAITFNRSALVKTGNGIIAAFLKFFLIARALHLKSRSMNLTLKARSFNLTLPPRV